MAHAAEWGRFYWPDGRPAYEVPSADGKKMVEPDIRHAKKLGLLPSVTTIIQEAAKPGLERWKVTQGILAALTLPRIDGESLDAFAERVMKDSQEQAKKAAEKGTRIHAAIQSYYDGSHLAEEDTAQYIGPVIDAVAEAYGEAGVPEWAAETTILRADYGGKRDLRRPGVTLDFKSKEFGPDHKKLAWDEHCIQLAAYREAGDRCANVFVSVNNPGLVVIHEWSEPELERGLAMFNALKSYYYARTGMKR